MNDFPISPFLAVPSAQTQDTGTRPLEAWAAAWPNPLILRPMAIANLLSPHTASQLQRHRECPLPELVVHSRRPPYGTVMLFQGTSSLPFAAAAGLLSSSREERLSVTAPEQCRREWVFVLRKIFLIESLPPSNVPLTMACVWAYETLRWVPRCLGAY